MGASRSHAVCVTSIALLLVPGFVACGARSSLGGFDGGDARVADARPDRDSALADADARDSGDASDSADAPDSADVTDTGTAGDSGAAALNLSVVGVTQDRVQPGDQGLTPDGQADGQFTATTTGAFDALILVTVDANGNPAYGQQWDTLVAQDPIPQGFAFGTGAQTWILGVWENNVRVNDAQGRVSISAAPHTLALHAASSGYFSKGMRFRLYGRTSGVWVSSNVPSWP